MEGPLESLAELYLLHEFEETSKTEGEITGKELVEQTLGNTQGW